jgi:hypothetical protein
MGPAKSSAICRLISTLCDSQFVSSARVSWFGLRARFFVPAHLFQRDARRDCHGWPRSGHPQGLAFTVPSTPPHLGVALGFGKVPSFYSVDFWSVVFVYLATKVNKMKRSERELAIGATVSSRHNLVCGGIRLDPDHDAAMRIDCEAPRRWAHSQERCQNHG